MAKKVTRPAVRRPAKYRAKKSSKPTGQVRPTSGQVTVKKPSGVVEVAPKATTLGGRLRALLGKTTTLP